MVNQILKSIGIIVITSAGIALPFYDNGFWKVFISACFAQPFLSWVVTTILDKLSEWKEANRENEQLEILSKHTINIPCPGCKNSMMVPIFCGEENIVVCDKCDNEVLIDVALTPIIKTKPVSDNVTIRSIFENLNSGEETAYNEANDSKE